MIKIRISKSKTDNGMLEITSVELGNTVLWAVVHEDFATGDVLVELPLEKNGEVDVYLETHKPAGHI